MVIRVGWTFFEFSPAFQSKIKAAFKDCWLAGSSHLTSSKGVSRIDPEWSPVHLETAKNTGEFEKMIETKYDKNINSVKRFLGIGASR